jgi:hypothetical protein
LHDAWGCTAAEAHHHLLQVFSVAGATKHPQHVQSRWVSKTRPKTFEADFSVWERRMKSKF